jgi:hypothetical protein
MVMLVIQAKKSVQKSAYVKIRCRRTGFSVVSQKVLFPLILRKHEPIIAADESTSLFSLFDYRFSGHFGWPFFLYIKQRQIGRRKL